ncbi:MAG: type III pantothenate kinase [Gammaproteobacteria bacterium]|nr:type III pantothenate kinase [Gammaproteobacteria bacterium]
MILLIDVGNSNIKWAFASQEGSILRRYHAPLIPEACDETGKVLRKLVSKVTLEQITTGLHQISTEDTSIALSSVRRDVAVQLLHSFPDHHFYEAKTLKEFNGLTNSYSEPMLMGIDRWLAMVGARQLTQGQSFLVVDSGTATTLDHVNEKGLHTGGYIIPGLNTQISSLLQSTDQVKAVFDDNIMSNKLGQSTQECVVNGVLAQTLSVIESTHRALNASMPTKLLLTGGAGRVLFNQLTKYFSALKSNCEYIDELVFYGLFIMQQEDLKKN